MNRQEGAIVRNFVLMEMEGGLGLGLPRMSYFFPPHSLCSLSTQVHNYPATYAWYTYLILRVAYDMVPLLLLQQISGKSWVRPSPTRKADGSLLSVKS